MPRFVTRPWNNSILPALTVAMWWELASTPEMHSGVMRSAEQLGRVARDGFRRNTRDLVPRRGFAIRKCSFGSQG